MTYLRSTASKEIKDILNLLEVQQECKHLPDTDVKVLNLLNATLKAIDFNAFKNAFEKNYTNCFLLNSILKAEGVVVNEQIRIILGLTIKHPYRYMYEYHRVWLWIWDWDCKAKASAEFRVKDDWKKGMEIMSLATGKYNQYREIIKKCITELEEKTQLNATSGLLYTLP